MVSTSATIAGQRLDLVLLSEEFLRCSLAGDCATAERLFGLSIPSQWFRQPALFEMRLQQLADDPAYGPWGLRAIVRRDPPTMVGQIGFHTPPGAAYLLPWASRGVEFGYTVYPPFRRRGYAREACLAVMKWAHDAHRVSEFIVSIGPENLASRRLAESCGFRQVGSHIDEQDGPEDVFKFVYAVSDVE